MTGFLCLFACSLACLDVPLTAMHLGQQLLCQLPHHGACIFILGQTTPSITPSITTTTTTTTTTLIIIITVTNMTLSLP